MIAPDVTERIRKLEALAARPGTPAEGAAARAAIDRLLARAPRPAEALPPRPLATLHPLGKRTLRRVLGILRTVAQASAGERSRLLFWATCRLREMVATREIDHNAGVQVLEALHATAMQAGLTQRETDRTITSAMTARRA